MIAGSKKSQWLLLRTSRETRLIKLDERHENSQRPGNEGGEPVKVQGCKTRKEMEI